ncbi:hypothetical protein JXB31_05770 [Candidatus Woesearchaeota archaeon]|nr:hypothetical protein [Candidatus Woesearchaeota archaeon]
MPNPSLHHILNRHKAKNTPEGKVDAKPDATPDTNPHPSKDHKGNSATARADPCEKHAHKSQNDSRSKSRKAKKYIISIKDAKKLFMDLPPEHRFWLEGGGEINNLIELSKELGIMSDRVFSHHVNHHKNDFSEWIRGVLKDRELAFMLSTITDRSTMLMALDAWLEKVKKRGLAVHDDIEDGLDDDNPEPGNPAENVDIELVDNNKEDNNNAAAHENSEHFPSGVVVEPGKDYGIRHYSMRQDHKCAADAIQPSMHQGLDSEESSWQRISDDIAPKKSTLMLKSKPLDPDLGFLQKLSNDSNDRPDKHNERITHSKISWKSPEKQAAEPHERDYAEIKKSFYHRLWEDAYNQKKLKWYEDIDKKNSLIRSEEEKRLRITSEIRLIKEAEEMLNIKKKSLAELEDSLAHREEELLNREEELRARKRILEEKLLGNTLSTRGCAMENKLPPVGVGGFVQNIDDLVEEFRKNVEHKRYDLAKGILAKIRSALENSTATSQFKDHYYRMLFDIMSNMNFLREYEKLKELKKGIKDVFGRRK